MSGSDWEHAEKIAVLQSGERGDCSRGIIDINIFILINIVSIHTEIHIHMHAHTHMYLYEDCKAKTHFILTSPIPLILF